MKRVLDTYYAAIVRCGQQLLRAVAVALDKPEDFITEKFRKPLARGSIIYYPPLPPDLGDRIPARRGGVRSDGREARLRRARRGK